MAFDMSDAPARMKSDKPLWIVADATWMCHRVFHTTPGLADGLTGTKTGVVYGFLRSVRRLQDRFQPAGIAFCFDGPRKNNLRRKLLPGYKASRDAKDDNMGDDERAARLGMFRQSELLRKEVLPAIGFNNVLYADGYEADDLVAARCQRLSDRGRECVVVGADKDLFQVLAVPGVSMFVPKHGQKGTERFVTAASFRAEWGIDPCYWPAVKAIAGCAGDDVPGLPGVAEKSAVKHLMGQGDKLPGGKGATIKAFAASPAYAVNLRLVQLPYPGTPTPPVKQDKVTSAAWKAAAKKLGFKSLLELDRG